MVIIESKMMLKNLLTLVCIGSFCALTAQQKITVAHKGRADFNNIQAAINSIKPNNSKLIVIEIAEGVYKEKIFIKNNLISLIGKNKGTTIITQSIARDEWRCNHPDDWGVATINVDSSTNISFANLTIQNNFGFENSGIKTMACTNDSSGKKIIGNNSHQMAFRSFSATKLRFVNCHFKAFGGDTMSPWNTTDGMFYFKDCVLEGGVDFYCPRGWAYAENCIFISHSGTAAIWHDGSLHKDSKTVLVNCSFKGFDGFKLGRYHRDAQFYLINCNFPANMADEDIYLVPTANTIQWGRRVYYFNCTKVNSNSNWFKNNIDQADGNPDPHFINAQWVFSDHWNPAKIK